MIFSGHKNFLFVMTFLFCSFAYADDLKSKESNPKYLKAKKSAKFWQETRDISNFTVKGIGLTWLSVSLFHGVKNRSEEGGFISILGAVFLVIPAVALASVFGGVSVFSNYKKNVNERKMRDFFREEYQEKKDFTGKHFELNKKIKKQNCF